MARAALAHVADQHIELTTASANFALSITSRAEVAMPVSLGFHRHFPAGPSTVLRCGVGRVRVTDADCLPTHRAAADHFADWRSRCGRSARHLDRQLP